MKSVATLGLQHSVASTIIGPLDIFYQAGVMWNFLNGEATTPFFDVKPVTTSGEPFRCLSGVRLIPDGSIHVQKNILTAYRGEAEEIPQEVSTGNC